jgi:hypothetical protein
MDKVNGVHVWFLFGLSAEMINHPSILRTSPLGDGRKEKKKEN